jgi:hypothetical protein
VQEAARFPAWSATATSNIYDIHTYSLLCHFTVAYTVALNGDLWTTPFESYPNSSNPTPANPEGNVHNIIVVGYGAITYDPSSIQADACDIVGFVFKTKKYTTTQRPWFIYRLYIPWNVFLLLFA